jgi:hypothetical protein
MRPKITEKVKTDFDNKSPRLNVSKYFVSLSEVRILETAVSDSLDLETHLLCIALKC